MFFYVTFEIKMSFLAGRVDVSPRCRNWCLGESWELELKWLQQESLVSFQRNCEEILFTNSIRIPRTVTPQTIQQGLGAADLFREEIWIFLDESGGTTSVSSSSNLVCTGLGHWLSSTSGKCELNFLGLFCFKPQGREFFSSCNF